MPEIAAGKTTRSVVCIRLAPMANDPCRRLCGTADIASSDRDATVGMIMMPRAMPAASALVKPTSTPKTPLSRFGVMKEMAKKP